MSTNILNRRSLSKLGGFFFIRQTPVTAPTHLTLASRFAEWRQQRRAATELSQLSDRALADIGLTRQQIPAAVRGQR